MVNQALVIRGDEKTSAAKSAAPSSCRARRGKNAAVHLADLSSDLTSATGPRCVSLSGLTRGDCVRALDDSGGGRVQHAAGEKVDGDRGGGHGVLRPAVVGAGGQSDHGEGDAEEQQYGGDAGEQQQRTTWDSSRRGAGDGQADEAADDAEDGDEGDVGGAPPSTGPPLFRAVPPAAQ